MTARRIILRALALVVVALALGGPTPGYVGNCGTGTTQSVNRVQFCTDRKTWECARDFDAGRITGAQYNDCVGMIDSACQGFNFPDGCAPSQQLADACIAALQNRGRESELNDDVVECKSTTLCGTATLTSPEGI